MRLYFGEPQTCLPISTAFVKKWRSLLPHNKFAFWGKKDLGPFYPAPLLGFWGKKDQIFFFPLIATFMSNKAN